MHAHFEVLIDLDSLQYDAIAAAGQLSMGLSKWQYLAIILISSASMALSETASQQQVVSGVWLLQNLINLLKS
jgi:hypothetical protein